jgi:pyruvate dehydrogenase E2 component (dihydrolipoamide acetyltransferase)
MAFVDRVARLLGVGGAASLRGLGVPPGLRTEVPSLLSTAPAAADAKATPLARRLAAGTGIALDGLGGSGPGGRITRADVERAAAPVPPPVPAPVPAPAVTIAAPRFTLSADVVADAALALCARFDRGLVLADVVAKAAALALRKVPEVNAEWSEAAIRRRTTIDVALGAAVITDADCKGLAEIAAWRGAERPAGFTIEVSAAQSITPVLPPPQAAALGLGAATQRPVVRDGALAVAHVATLTLSADHRVVDGATAARFLDAVKDLVENPVTLLL